MTIQTGANLYTQGYGSRPENVEIPYYSGRSPSTLDIKYPLGKRWINTVANTEFSLTSFVSFNGSISATWTLLSNAGAGFVVGLTGDNSLLVSPDVNGNINIFGGTGISTFSFPGSNEISINALSSDVNWNQLSANATLTANQSYLCTGGGNLQLFLPLFSNFGDMIAVYLDGASGFTIRQSSGQQVRLGSSTTTLGTGGSMASILQGDGFTAVCKTANTLWTITENMGNLTIL